MSIFKLKPVRDEAKENAKLVVDLDAIIVETVSFKFQGKLYYIKPISTERFIKIAARLAQLDGVRSSKEVDLDAALRAYFELFKESIEDFTWNDIRHMSHPQIGALLQLILDTVTGKSSSPKGSEKKK